MKIYHLSHTDLDGYGCQYVIKQYFKDCVFYNSNYGKEINDNFSLILSHIEKDLMPDENEEVVILITDLNLSLAQCEEFSTAIKGKNIKLLLLDHHQSGLECFLRYDWYFLDSSRCASKIVYEFFAKVFEPNEELARLISVINAVDIWLSDESDFELGKVMLAMISSAKELNRTMFTKDNNAYMFYLLDRARDFIHKEKPHIALEDSLHGIKKDFFKEDEDNTLGNLLAHFVVKKLSEDKERFTIVYEGHKGLLTSNIGNTSVIGNDFLVKNPDFDFFIDVSSKKTLSFRANGKLDVSLMAKKLVGGGGHKNASGGFFAAFRDSFNYELIKEQIMLLIRSKTGDELRK